MAQLEDVQYFKFDQSGNMYIYEPGSVFGGDCHILSPGDELVFNRSLVNDNGNDEVLKLESDLSPQVSCDGLTQRSGR